MRECPALLREKRKAKIENKMRSKEKKLITRILNIFFISPAFDFDWKHYYRLSLSVYHLEAKTQIYTYIYK